MPGLDWDLNLDPELQAAARRLSFSDADFPSSRCGLSDLKVPHPNPIFHATSRNQSRLPTISENTSDELAATQAPALEQCTGPPLSLGTAGWLYQGRGETPTPTAGAPVATSLPLASPGSSQSQQFLDAGAAARMLEQRRQAELLGSFGEHQQRRQQGLAADAGLQQAAAAARPQPQVLMLYTVDGGAAGYDTKWDELHPVSQGLLLQIEDNIREYRYDSEQLDECSHLDDLSPFNFEFDAGQITQVEHNHQSAETMKTQYLKDRRCRDDWSNPFHKANRREEAKQQATAGIIHPMLHLSPLGQPTTLVAVPMISSQLQQTLFPIVATSPSSYPVLASHLLLRHLSQYHMKVEWQFQASIVYLLAEGSHPEETANRAFHILFLEVTWHMLSLTARGRQPREIICDLDWGWRSWEEASPWGLCLKWNRNRFFSGGGNRPIGTLRISLIPSSAKNCNFVNFRDPVDDLV
ncbi:uncharacterized protein LOC120649652 isoform X6 [Panicum virgatum]|uniref:uncharacterized protein LOC120649652 isoform X6 n=1 Tax=Panicum virgatum TaxID=38727 RepID=UPI0019D541CB|nr:uncharacterized protein LOC120649652 isoform X6 [Panicum virgatum]